MAYSDFTTIAKVKALGLEVYGCVTTGTAWKFLKLEGAIASIDVNEYSITPVDFVLGVIVWMVRQFEN